MKEEENAHENYTENKRIHNHFFIAVQSSATVKQIENIQVIENIQPLNDHVLIEAEAGEFYRNSIGYRDFIVRAANGLVEEVKIDEENHLLWVDENNENEIYTVKYTPELTKGLVDWLIKSDVKVSVVRNSDLGVGKVIKVGQGKCCNSGELTPVTVNGGDRVLARMSAGTEIMVDGKKYLLIAKGDILAIIH